MPPLARTVSDAGATITPCPASVTFTAKPGPARLAYSPLDADAACVRVTVSPTTSPSFRARTVTVCLLFQLPLLPPVKVSVAVWPAVPPGPSTSSTSRLPAGTVTVTVAVATGSVCSQTR